MTAADDTMVTKPAMTKAAAVQASLTPAAASAPPSASLSPSPSARPTPAAEMWLPAGALTCYEGNARLRSWLTESGRLTQRVREACGPAFHLVVVDEFADGDEHVREIELACSGQAWIFAQSRLPRGTLQRQPWLAHIGGRSLGEALAGHDRVTRSDFEFARLMPDHPVIARALERSRLPPQPLWMRRSTFTVGGDPLLVQEVFMPCVAKQG